MYPYVVTCSVGGTRAPKAPTAERRPWIYRPGRVPKWSVEKTVAKEELAAASYH